MRSTPAPRARPGRTPFPAPSEARCRRAGWTSRSRPASPSRPRRPRVGSTRGLRPPQRTGSAVSQESNDRAIARLAGLVRRNSPCVVLTGAGISTESGIPDFRSPTGLWAEFDPMEYATIEAFRADPEKVWRFYGPRISMLTEAQPNAAHHALAELEELGYVSAIVTQNIDLLHERARSREVVEVHGSIRTSTCPQCGASQSLEGGGSAPLCLLRGGAQARRRLLRRALARPRDRPRPAARPLGRPAARGR